MSDEIYFSILSFCMQNVEENPSTCIIMQHKIELAFVP